MNNDVNISRPSALSAIPFGKLRVALAVLSLMAASMPVISMTAFGVSKGFTLADGIGPIIYLIPLACVAALVAAYHPPLRQHSDLADKVVAGILGFLLLWGFYEVIGLIMQAAEFAGQMRGMGMPSVSFNDLGNLFNLFSPSLGLLGLVGTYALGFVPVMKGRKQLVIA